MQSFTGVKIALLCDSNIIVTLRDNKPTIPYPNMWDLPGGGREQNETPFECAVREVKEELGIPIHKEDIVWQRNYPSLSNPGKQAYFMVAKIDQERVDAIMFGDEGQAWKNISVDTFLTDNQVIPQLQDHLSDFLNKYK